MDWQDRKLKALDEEGARGLEFLNDLTNKGITQARALQILRDRRISQAKIYQQSFRYNRGGKPWPSR